MVIGLNKSDAIIIKVLGFEPILVRIADSEGKRNVRLVIEAQSEVDVSRKNRRISNDDNGDQ
jgi:ABC-type Zn uptake system ZnuABC Zn-binding protein ZnuA